MAAAVFAGALNAFIGNLVCSLALFSCPSEVSYTGVAGIVVLDSSQVMRIEANVNRTSIVRQMVTLFTIKEVPSFLATWFVRWRSKESLSWWLVGLAIIRISSAGERTAQCVQLCVLLRCSALTFSAIAAADVALGCYFPHEYYGNVTKSA